MLFNAFVQLIFSLSLPAGASEHDILEAPEAEVGSVTVISQPLLESKKTDGEIPPTAKSAPRSYVHAVPAPNPWSCRTYFDSKSGNWVSTYDVFKHNCHHAANAGAEADLVFPPGTPNKDALASPDNKFAAVGVFQCIGTLDKASLEGHTINWYRSFCDSNPDTKKCHRVCLFEPQLKNHYTANAECCWEGSPTLGVEPSPYAFAYADRWSAQTPEMRACMSRLCIGQYPNKKGDGVVKFHPTKNRGELTNKRTLLDTTRAGEWYCGKQIDNAKWKADPEGSLNSCRKCCISESAYWDSTIDAITDLAEKRAWRKARYDFYSNCSEKCTRIHARQSGASKKSR